ncbi:hypothetical protein Poly59_55310 [Rubripirellula reticaptiva]|uniref:Uncharacterized protein n=1 Tax=Rubripirellula reticaptiva TaxID=2528013 RepID=A0A5C6ECD9_9BACT|nr:hypothetical protein Poly59_55310 [Rubripirellula reticaptiva]
MEIAKKQATTAPMPLAINEIGQPAFHRIRQANKTETFNPIAIPGNPRASGHEARPVNNTTAKPIVVASIGPNRISHFFIVEFLII